MTSFLAFTVVGFATGCIYALTASGLVVTYTTSGIFNFAHGAIGMLMAFMYWELTVKNGWPQLLGLVVVLGIVAPALGALIERFIMRRLHGATTSTTLVVTLGLLLAFIGVASTRWTPSEARVLPEFFAGNSISVFSINISYHQLTMITVAVLVAAFLRLFFFRTRIGIAMRAVVDDPELASMNGADPDRVSATSWAMGAAMAGLAGILLAPLVTLDIVLLTLLVINGYAAAMVGRLKSLPLTFAGGIALGLAEAYTIGNLPSNLVNTLKPALPIIFLYVVLLVLPQARLRGGRLAVGRPTPRVATFEESLLGAGVFLGGAVVACLVLSGENISLLTQGVVFGLIMLSLVLLTGYAGQVSLCQMTFVGLGAFAMGKWFGDGSVLGLVVAVVFSAAVGAVAALPALRLQGLYLALSTLAFAQAMSALFFENAAVMGAGGRLAVPRPKLFGLSFAGDRSYFILVCVVFAAAGIGVLWLRRGPFGRRLVAMKDSPAACATLGLSLTTTKLAVFALSAGLAGLAGAFFGGISGQVGATNFLMLQSLVLLLLVTISGINTVSGALFGGITFGLFPKFQAWLPGVRNLSYVAAGLGALGISRNPNGWTNEVGPTIESLRDRFGGRGLRPARSSRPISPGEASTNGDGRGAEEVAELARTTH